MTIFGLREVDDRTQAVDPSNVSGNISVLLDVQYNDETVTNVDLTLGDEVISCRGASSDAASPVGVAPTGLAESGGSVEIECFFDTDQVAGECTGMQMAPRFANGEHELGARITTADGTTRDALASQMITLKNSNYVMIDHNPGSVSKIVGGVTFYGGPTTEENVNTFDVCPVAFDGTMVGKIGLRGMTDTVQEEGDSYNDDLSFRTHRQGRYGEYNGVRRVDDEAPFTFTVLSSQNAYTEDRNADGHGGHWIIQDGVISDPDGLDISNKFVPSDMENDLTKIGPIYFDFAAPRVSGDSEVTIEGDRIANVYYSGKRATYDGRSQRFGVSGVTERGAGGTSDVIAVGDCSVGANTDTGRDGAGTAFQAIVEDAAAVGDLPEDDPDAGNLSDDGGVQCYTAELQALTDRMGNSRDLSRVRIQSAANFGVDKTGPEIDDVEPDEELVLMDGADLTFEVEDPELETGERGSGFDGAATRAYWGTSWPNRYFRTGYGDADDPGNVIAENNGVVTIETNTGVAAADRERRHVVNVEVRDSAVPPNLGNVSFAYTRDAEGPAITLSKSQSDIGSINTATITVGVGGTISDANVIKKAELSIREKVGTATCMASTDLDDGRGNPVVRNKRDLENNTNEIVFDESFTLRQAEGEKTYCFWLASADVAVAANGRGDGNMGNYELGSFTVDWPAGEPPPPPGPTFEFFEVNATDGTIGDDATTSLELLEGTSASYAVKLTQGTAATVNLTASDGATVTPSTLTFPNADGTSDTLHVSVTAGHDRDVTTEDDITVTHSATDFDDAVLTVTSNDDDVMLEVRESSVTEGGDTETFHVVATLTTARAAGTDVTVGWTFGGGTAASSDYAATGVTDIVISGGDMSDSVEVTLTGADDIGIEGNETVYAQASSPSDAPYIAPAMVTIMDDDPNVELTVTPGTLSEGDDATTLMISATSKVAMPGVFDVAVTVPAPTGTEYELNGASSAVTVTLTIDTGETQSNTQTVSIDPAEDADTNDVTIAITGPSAGQRIVGDTGTGKVYSIKSAMVTIEDNDDS